MFEKPKRLKLRGAINAAGDNFFERMYNLNEKLGYIAAEFMESNEEYVLNHYGEEETNKTTEILQTGFTTNQKRFLERLSKTLIEGERK